MAEQVHPYVASYVVHRYRGIHAQHDATRPGTDTPVHAHHAHAGLRALEEPARFLCYYVRPKRMVSGAASDVLQPDEAAQRQASAAALVALTTQALIRRLARRPRPARISAAALI
jgi:hypothetical protein